jgi:hypothetical protein
MRQRPAKALAKVGTLVIRRPCEELGQPHQIVGCSAEGEGPSDALETAEPGLSLPGDGLDPAERFLDPLADAQADPIAAMARRSPIDRRASPIGVLRHVRPHLHRAQFVDEVLRVIALVGAQRDRIVSGASIA